MSDATMHELVQRFDTTSRTIRYYETMGLVTPRRQGNQRFYDRAQVVRLERVMEWRRVGVPISDIQTILFYGTDETAVLRTRLRTIAEERKKLDAQQADLIRQLHARFADPEAA